MSEVNSFTVVLVKRYKFPDRTNSTELVVAGFGSLTDKVLIPSLRLYGCTVSVSIHLFRAAVFSVFCKGGGGEAIGTAVCSHAREEGGGDNGVLVVGGGGGGRV